jgi:hypothetical protein
MKFIKFFFFNTFLKFKISKFYTPYFKLVKFYQVQVLVNSLLLNLKFYPIMINISLEFQRNSYVYILTILLLHVQRRFIFEKLINWR